MFVRSLLWKMTLSHITAFFYTRYTSDRAIIWVWNVPQRPCVKGTVPGLVWSYWEVVEPLSSRSHRSWWKMWPEGFVALCPFSLSLLSDCAVRSPHPSSCVMLSQYRPKSRANELTVTSQPVNSSQSFSLILCLRYVLQNGRPTHTASQLTGIC